MQLLFLNVAAVHYCWRLSLDKAQRHAPSHHVIMVKFC